MTRAENKQSATPLLAGGGQDGKNAGANAGRAKDDKNHDGRGCQRGRLSLLRWSVGAQKRMTAAEPPQRHSRLGIPDLEERLCAAHSVVNKRTATVLKPSLDVRNLSPT